MELKEKIKQIVITKLIIKRSGIGDIAIVGENGEKEIICRNTKININAPIIMINGIQKEKEIRIVEFLKDYHYIKSGKILATVHHAISVYKLNACKTVTHTYDYLEKKGIIKVV